MATVKWKKDIRKESVGRNGWSGCQKLKEGVILFRREPANKCTTRNQFFLNKFIPLWNELPQKVREAVAPKSIKAGLDKMKLFLT